MPPTPLNSHNHANSSLFSLSRLGIGAMIGAVLVLLCGCSRDPVAAGLDHMKTGNYPSAVIEFKNAVQAQPESAEARVMLADVMERVHDLAGAEEQLRKAIANSGDETILVPRLALIMLDVGDLDKLIRDFKDKRLKSPEADSSLRGTVAIAFLGQKRTTQAQAQLAGVIDTASVVLAKAQLLLIAGKIPEAMAILDKTKADTATPWWVLRAIARIATAGGDPLSAAKSLKLAHETVPWHLGVKGEYGEALIAAGNNDEATIVRDQLRKRAPGYFWTHYLDALLLARAGRSEESHAATLKVLAISPEHIPSTLLAAAAELQKGDVLMADKRLRALVKQQPNSLPALRLFAQSQMRLGRSVDGMDTVRRGLNIAPNDPQLLGIRAELEVARGDRKQAIATLKTLLSVRPDEPSALLRLADLHFGMKEFPEATRLTERAGAVTKDDTVMRGRVVASALRMGNPTLARQFADEGVALKPNDAQAQLTLAATQSAQNDRVGSWKTTLAVLDQKPAHSMALAALSAMSKTPEQNRELLARYAKALDANTPSQQAYLDYASLVRVEPTSAVTPLIVYERGVNALPGAVAIRQALVEEYLRNGSADKALSTAQIGAAIANAPPDATALLAATHERLGSMVLATDGYRKLVSNNPQRADWRLKLAQLEVAANRRAEASTLLRALMTERPFDISSYLALANLTVKDNPSEAMSIARQLGEREEFKGAAMLLEGDLLLQSGKKDEALKQFAKATKAGMVPAAMLRSVQLLDQTGNTAAANQELNHAIRRFPDDTSVIGFSAQRALEAGNADLAADLLQKLAARMPNNPIVLNDLAWAQIQAGRPQALMNARKAVTALPNNVNALDTLAIALAKTNKRDEAIATLRTATNLAPTAAVPRLHLSEQLLAAGDRAGAIAAMRLVKAEQLSAKDQLSLSKLKSALGEA